MSCLGGELWFAKTFVGGKIQANQWFVDGASAHMAIPFGSLINASKSAFGILSDTLRLELHPFGIRVAVVELGAIKTPAVEKTLVLHRHSAESVHSLRI